MILIDSSAWIEFLRGTDSPVCARVHTLLNHEIATCHPIQMEILAGARDEANLRQLRGLLARAATIQTLPSDYDTAAALYRSCRRRGQTVRKMIDCLIAAHALRMDIPLLHADSDFEALERYAGLKADRT